MYILKCCTHIKFEQTLAVYDICSHAQPAAGYGHLQILKPNDQQTTAGRPHDPSLNYV